MKKRLIVLLSALVCAGAQAEFKDGNQLYSQMQKEFASVEWFNAIGYITGVADTLSGITVCGPAGTAVPASQVYDIVKQYLKDNPSLRHLSGDRLVNRALERVFPCQKKGQAL